MTIFLLYLASVLFFFFGSLGLISVLDATRPSVAAPVLYKGQPKPEDKSSVFTTRTWIGLAVVSNLMTCWLLCTLSLAVTVLVALA
jgi:hypothetical protein